MIYLPLPSAFSTSGATFTIARCSNNFLLHDYAKATVGCRLPLINSICKVVVIALSVICSAVHQMLHSRGLDYPTLFHLIFNQIDRARRVG
jgi:hypothetical protein